MNRKKVVYLYIIGKKVRIVDKDLNSFYFGSWSGLLSKYISQINPNISWFNIRQDYSVVNTIEHYIDGVNVELFPFEKRMLFGILSYKLLRRLRTLTTDKSTILHCFHTHSFTSYLIVWLFRKNPIVLTNYGSTPPNITIKSAKSLFKKVKLFVLNLIERVVYRYVDVFTPSGVFERSYLKTIFPNLLITDFDHFGVDFDFFSPLDKENARNIVGLPRDAKIMLYVGHIYELKGVDAILESYYELKNCFNDIILILIGASEQDQLYYKAIHSGAIVIGRIEQDLLKVYYSASDVYLMPNFDSPDFVNFGGIGTSPLEALACNTPVISSHLIHFPNDYVDFVGVNPHSRSELTSSIKRVLENPEEFKDCRNVAKAFYDRNLIAIKLITLYSKLQS